MTNQLFLKDMPQGAAFDNALLVRNVNYRTTKNGKPYIDLELSDMGGIVSGKLWDTPHTQIPDISGQVVAVKGVVEHYQNEPQLRISHIQPLPETDPRNNPDLYTTSAPVELAVMQQYIVEKTKQIAINHPEYSQLIQTILMKNNQAFWQMPAAKKIHHAFKQGLLYHTYRMLQSAERLADIYPQINQDLVQTAIILHDAGKIAELSGIYNTEITPAGVLLGHIAIVDGWIIEASIANQIDPNSEKIVLLRQCILAHHGKLEYGSPVLPSLPESLFINKLDMLDAEMMQTETVLQDVEPGNLTPRIWALNNQAIYQKGGDKDLLPK